MRELRGVARTHAVDGTRRFVSPSELVSAAGCWRAYRWKRDGLQPIQKFEALSFGIAWDAFIGEWWRPVGKPGDGMVDVRSIDERFHDALRAAQVAMDNDARRVDAVLLERGIPRPQDWLDQRSRISSLLLGMAIHYVELFGERDASGRLTCRASQFRVEVPLPSQSGKRRSRKFWMRGFIDRVMEDNETNLLGIEDDKTTGRVSAAYGNSFEYDLQLPLYAWALQSLGNEIGWVGVSAAGKLLPTFPELRKTPVDVLGPDGEPLTRPLLCEACEGKGTVLVEADPEWGMVSAEPEPCAKCEGTGHQRFKSGPRAGEVKTEKVRRPALYTMLSEDGSLNYTTNLAAFDSALVLHDLDPADYERERAYLIQQDETDSPYFGNFDLLVDRGMIEEAEYIIRTAAPELDKIPDVPLRDRFRCERCQFRVPCIERDPAARAELLHQGFTTRAQRDAEREAREAVVREAQERERVEELAAEFGLTPTATSPEPPEPRTSDHFVPREEPVTTFGNTEPPAYVPVPSAAEPENDPYINDIPF